MYRRSSIFVLLFLLTIWVSGWLLPSFATVPQVPADIPQSNAPATAKRTFEQGRSLYTAGKFAEAADAFQQAAQGYQRQGNRLNLALSLSNLALCYQQLSLWPEANQAIHTAIAVLEGASPDLTGSNQTFALAQALEIRGSLELAQGRAALALATWQQAAKINQQRGDLERAIANQINQAQALQVMGHYRRAISLLTGLLKLELSAVAAPNSLELELQSLPTSEATTLALQSLGEALRTIGNLEPSRLVLQRSLAIATQLQNPKLIAIAQLKLANVLRALAITELNLSNLSPARATELVNLAQQGQRFRQTDTAVQFSQQMQELLKLYEQAATHPSQRTQAWLNRLTLLIQIQQWSSVQTLLPQIWQQVSHLPASHAGIYARINLAHSVMQLLARREVAKPPTPTAIAQLLGTTIQQSRELQDRRAESYALGTLGRLYEQNHQPQDAQTVTQQALALAQATQAPDIMYLWQWQLGRLLKAQGNTADAIVAYQEAVNTLRLVRKELAATTPEEQFSFRDTIEPIHRELVALLLNPEDTPPNPQKLKLARDVIESLQLTELVNFFREDCLLAKPAQIDQLDPTAAVLYPIILPNRLAIILSLPGQPLTYYATSQDEKVTSERIEALTNHLHLGLLQGNTPDSEILPDAEQLYDWLIRPVQAELAAKQIKTLVFVLDGVLRNIPMTVLRDRQQNQYLIEQFSIALTPGLQLLGTHFQAQSKPRALVAGLTDARFGFSALPNVEAELQQIQTQLPNSQILLNTGFTSQKFQANLRASPFPIVHLATHGQFSSQLDSTFVLTWDNRLSVNQLRDLLQTTGINQKEVLELLVLSACETAAGDNRAALGLAGVAVRAGARSTLATLWQVNDTSSTLLMSQFYQALLQSKLPKAEALRHAQLSLLKNSQNPDYQRPYYWAAYVLVGNWL